MIIKNVQIFTEDKYFEEGNIYIKDGVFVEPFEEDDVVIDGEGCYAIPGLVDVHFHGCMGADFCDGTPEAIATIAEYEASQGVTTIVPATMTLSEEELTKIYQEIYTDMQTVNDLERQRQQAEYQRYKDIADGIIIL